MSNAAKFFKENATIVNSKTDPVAYNLNAGMLAFAEETAQELHRLRQELHKALQALAAIEARTRR